MMPPHTHYVEPYAGGLAVLFAKPCEGVSEVVNDLDGELINFWRVLQRPESFELLKRRLEATPFSREEFYEARDGEQLDPIDRAASLFIRARQSFSGNRKDFSPPPRRVRGGMNGSVNGWLNAVDGLPEVYERIRRIAVENTDAIKLIKHHDSLQTMFYCDPPYLHETRVVTDAYNAEMTKEQHVELLNTLFDIKGKFVLSGYPSPLYNDFAALAGWNRREIDVANYAAGGETKRRMTEVLWYNYNLEG